MIADAHIHLFRHGYWRKRGLSPLGTTSDLAAYARFRRQHQIGQSLVVGYEGDDIDPTNNDYIARLVAQHNWIVPLAYFDENATADAVARHLAAGHCGIALYLEDAAAAARLKRWPQEIWALLSAHRALVSLNAGPAAIAELGTLIADAPRAQFLFSHLGLPGKQGDISALLELVPLNNVGIKLSGIYAIDPQPPHHGARPVLDLIFDRVPARHLHWGSDFSPALGAIPFTQTLEVPGLNEHAPDNIAMMMGAGLMVKIANVCKAPD